MEKEFIPYEEALALKELGFDEPCLCYYLKVDGNRKIHLVKQDLEFQGYNYILAPLYQQSFRWFREKYNLHSQIEIDSEEKWTFSIYNLLNLNSLGIYGDQFETYKEAELECLKKLIEIIKNK